MPTYEYECTNCGHAFEVSQKMSDKPLHECPKCKGSVKRLIGKGSGIIFKGSGFYETDYKRKETKKPARRSFNEGGKDSKCEKADSSPKCKSCPNS